uniref:hypothetical protein n=1 Tax=Nonomuraea bangladeshensis TaxID=404385 RepID=UPI003F493632
MRPCSSRASMTRAVQNDATRWAAAASLASWPAAWSLCSTLIATRAPSSAYPS